MKWNLEEHEEVDNGVEQTDEEEIMEEDEESDFEKLVCTEDESGEEENNIDKVIILLEIRWQQV